jgi:hypothetical protein
MQKVCAMALQVHPFARRVRREEDANGVRVGPPVELLLHERARLFAHRSGFRRRQSLEQSA